jgi:hypothetical protein
MGGGGGWREIRAAHITFFKALLDIVWSLTCEPEYPRPSPKSMPRLSLKYLTLGKMNSIIKVYTEKFNSDSEKRENEYLW